MGLFGQSPKEVSRGGKVVYEMECNRSKCRRRKFVHEKKSECKSMWASHQRDHDYKAAKGAKAIKQLKSREKKGKCSSCGKDPCRMDRKGCVVKAIEKWGSSTDLDVSDPATFDEQLKWYRDHM